MKIVPSACSAWNTLLFSLASSDFTVVNLCGICNKLEREVSIVSPKWVKITKDKCRKKDGNRFWIENRDTEAKNAELWLQLVPLFLINTSISHI